MHVSCRYCTPWRYIKSSGLNGRQKTIWSWTVSNQLNWSYTDHVPELGTVTFHQPSDGVTRLNNIQILGVIVTDALPFEMHISGVISKCAQTNYALWIMRAHGLNGQALWEVSRSTLVSKLMYAFPVWLGFLNEESIGTRCQAVLNQMKRAGYLEEETSLDDFTASCVEIADVGSSRRSSSNTVELIVMSPTVTSINTDQSCYHLDQGHTHFAATWCSTITLRTQLYYIECIIGSGRMFSPVQSDLFLFFRFNWLMDAIYFGTMIFLF